MLAKGEAAGGLAAQEGESVAGFLTLALYVGEFGLGSGHFGLGSGEIGLRDGSGFELVVEKVHKFFPQGDGAAQGVSSASAARSRKYCAATSPVRVRMALW